ncbi:unnamed protein product [Cylindrotheca closterium]|uniref:Uncharacterized protein n=1 Tax=Cylindrotheca closterium TaxID=2856 RepID=A0AAD2PVA7_9STRA|nr:unnamed protein product [Cylindrotheca closterium]
MSEAKYELVDVEIEEGGQDYTNNHHQTSASTTTSGYPGFLRKGASPAPGPPAGTVFVKTGGNALQAIGASILEQESVVRVIVPEGKMPGDSILVQCPHIHGRYVPTIIPGDAKQGTEFLVRIPPLNEDQNFSNSDIAAAGAMVVGKVTAKSALIAVGVASGVLLL